LGSWKIWKEERLSLELVAVWSSKEKGGMEQPERESKESRF